MRKLMLAAATLAAISTSALADTGRGESEDGKFNFQRAYHQMMQQMIDDEVMAAEMHMKRLTSYQRILKQMMEQNDSGSSHGNAGN